MPFEALDKKAKEAAEQFHPPYNQEAWTKMTSLLDAQLPRDDEPRRRRGLLWLLPAALLVGGAVWLFNAKPWKSRQASVTAAKGRSNSTSGTRPASGSGTTLPQAGADNSSTNSENNESSKVPASDGSGSVSVSTNDQSLPTTQDAKGGQETRTVNGGQPAGVSVQPGASGNGNVDSRRIGLAADAARQTVGTETQVRPGSNVSNTARLGVKITPAKTGTRKPDREVPKQPDNQGRETIDNEKTDPVQDDKVSDQGVKPVQDVPVVPQPPVAPTVDSTTNLTVHEKPPTTNNKMTATAKPAAASTRKSRFAKWLFSVSAGADVSQVSAEMPGTYKAIGGFGIGYLLSKKLLVRTGIYQADKIYGANPEDYNVKVNYSQPGYKLVDIAAQCRVIQVPVTVSFIQPLGRKSNLIVGAGLSSVWMKKEKYDYGFQSDYGSFYRTTSYEISNQNRHLFSMISASAGYERRLSPVFSLLAEPYVHLPVSGVGLGKVKLKSAGLLVSVAVRPFAKK